MKKRKVITCIFICLTVLAFAFICFINYKNNKNFFTFSLYEILTLCIALIFTYYFTLRDKKRDMLKEKISELINKLISKINSPTIKIEKTSFTKEEMLIEIKTISNYLHILYQYSDKFISTKSIEKIKMYWKNYKELVSDDLGNKKLLLANKNKTDKALSNLESSLSFALFSLYDSKLKQKEDAE